MKMWSFKFRHSHYRLVDCGRPGLPLSSRPQVRVRPFVCSRSHADGRSKFVLEAVPFDTSPRVITLTDQIRKFSSVIEIYGMLPWHAVAFLNF